MQQGIRLGTLLLLVVNLVACGGGGSTGAADTTQKLTLSSIAEAGNSSSFSAYLLTQVLGSGTPNTTGIVLLHGRGGNPDSAVVSELRRDLFNRGYTTISIQEPVPSGYTEGDSVTIPPYSEYVDDVNMNGNAVFLEAYARIRTAINTLSSRGMTQIVLIGFSLGSRMVTAHIGNGQVDELPIIGLVGIGMYAAGTDPDPLNTIATMASVDVPVLEIYGSNDTPASTTTADRKTAHQTGSGVGLSYTQAELNCGTTTNPACHRLDGLKGTSSSPLETTVAAWIADL